MALIEIVVDDKEALAYMRGLRADLWPRVFKDAAKEIEREALREFRRTTTTWHHKPVFESLIEVKSTSLEIIVGTDDRIYGYVDKGTRPHEIRPKGPWPLKFRAGYKAKTTPGIIGSHAGGPTGDTVRARRVWHPGTRPRNFGSMIQNYMDKKGYDILDNKVDKWLGKRYV